MERREFIRRASLTGLAVAGSTVGAGLLYDPRGGGQYFRDELIASAKTLPSYAVDRGANAVTMAIAHGTDPDEMVRAAIGAMGGIERFIEKGDVVLLKPNVAFDRAPLLGATTSPGVLKAVAGLCREAGAKKIIVADNPINQPEGCFFKSGIKAAADEIGAELMLPRPSAFADVKIGGDVLGTWTTFYEPFAAADKVIGIAPCKDHNLCSGSMTMKNWYGMLGGRRNQFHQHIHGIVSDFPHMVKPTFVLLDATRVLMRNGPTGGSLSDVATGDTLVVGTDMVAVDTYGYSLLGRDAANLEYLHRAQKRALGTMDWKSQNWREVQVG